MTKPTLSITIGLDGEMEIDIEGSDDECVRVAAKAEAILGCMGIETGERKDERRDPRVAVGQRKKVKSG